MKTTYLLISLAMGATAHAAMAANIPALPAGIIQTSATTTEAPAPAGNALPAMTDNAQLDESLRKIQHEWAHIKYSVKNKDDQTQQMEALVAKASALAAQYPSYAEPKIWQAITLSTQAGFDGGLGALGLCKDAKALLEQAEKINPNTLDGSVYTSLGSLYYKVPAWPIGFGDNAKALAYLEQARALNPNGIDPNYFYGDYLIEQGKYADAIVVLQKALQAPARPGREDADAGRRQDIHEAIAKAQAELKG